MKKAYLLLSAAGVMISGSAAAQTTEMASSEATVTAVDSTETASSLSEAGIGDIVVTASRRESTIRKTPTAVSAYGGDQLQKAQISSLTDLIAITPSIQIATFSTNANITIRGVGNTQIAPGSDPGVALHADGVYLGQPYLAISTFLDVNRVEILRGPQGTLFGRNATGGAVNIIPNTPTPVLHYGADVTVGLDPGLVRSSAYVSGPLTDDGKVTGRIAVQENYNRGYSKNLLQSGPQHLDGIGAYGGRAQLQWEPSGAFTSRLLVEYQKQSDDGPAQYFVGTPDASIPLPTPLQGALTSNEKRRQTYANQGERRLSALTVNSVSDISLGDGNLKILLSHIRSKAFTDSDGDGTPVDFTDSQFRFKAYQHFGEAVYASAAGMPFTYVLGANIYYNHERASIMVPISTFPMPVMQTSLIKTTSYAFFGQGNYEFTEGGKIFAGARYSHDRKTIKQTNNYVSNPSLASQGDSFSRLTYELGISYDLTRSVTGYLKYATGYKSGGFSAGNFTPAFFPETNRNIEAGLKGSFLGDALQANISAFHMAYNNLQVSQVVGLSGSVVTNAAQATVYGVEVESIIRPTENFRIEANGAWVNASFDKFVTSDSARPGLGVLNLSGNRLPNAPRFTASVGAFYVVPLHSGSLTLGSRYDWKDDIFFSEFNIPVSGQKAAGKLDLSVRFEDESRRWNASVFATNVTDEKIRSNVLVVSAVLGSLGLANLQPGRQIGASISYKY